MINASAVRKTAPTLCILRTLSKTTIRGIFSVCLKVSTSILPSSSSFSFLVVDIFVFLTKLIFKPQVTKFLRSVQEKSNLRHLRQPVKIVRNNPMAKAKKETPLMTQYNTIKAKYPDALLLFRIGDFYETFGT